MFPKGRCSSEKEEKPISPLTLSRTLKKMASVNNCAEPNIGLSRILLVATRRKT
jgi:hypothetical protein